MAHVVNDRDMHRVVGTVLVYRPDRTFLITKRSDKLKVLPGKWTVPGGGLEVDDYIDTLPTHKAGQWYNALDRAIQREIREETSLTVGKLSYLTNIAFIRPDKKAVLVLSFYAPYQSGEVRLSEEDCDFAWIRASEADKYDLIDGIADEIK